MYKYMAFVVFMTIADAGFYGAVSAAHVSHTYLIYEETHHMWCLCCVYLRPNNIC